MSVSAEANSEIVRLRKQVSAGEKVISLSGLTSIASKAFVLSNLQNETKQYLRYRRRFKQRTRKLGM